MNRAVVVAVVVLGGLALASPTAAGALIPTFDRHVARAGERVTVTLGRGGGQEFFPAPLEVYLVPICREGARDRRLATVHAGPYGVINTQRFRFRVPAVPAGQYTLAILVRTPGGGRENIVRGLWHFPNLAQRLILRVRTT